MLSSANPQMIMDKFILYLDNVISEIINQPFNEEDHKFAFNLLEIEADKKNTSAQYYLGICYFYGINIDEDKAKAFDLFLKAAEKNDAYAQHCVGYCYQNGYGTKKNEKKALEYYQKSSDHGCSQAQSNLEAIHLNDSSRDAKKSFDFFLKAAEKNDAFALDYLGLIYENGYGVQKDEKKAFQSYKKSAEQNYVPAITNLAHCYQYAIGTVENNKKSLELYIIAAEYGNANAQNLLGGSYIDGLLTPNDDKKGCEWFQKSANQNCAAAQGNLGFCYKLGRGVDENFSLASVWFAKAANLNDPAALDEMQTCYSDIHETPIVDKAPEKITPATKEKSFEFYHQKLAACIPAVKGWTLWSHLYLPLDGPPAIVLNYLIITPYIETNNTRDFIDLRSHFLNDEQKKFTLFAINPTPIIATQETHEAVKPLSVTASTNTI